MESPFQQFDSPAHLELLVGWDEENLLRPLLLSIAVVWRTRVPMIVAEKERQDGMECQKDACFVVRSIALFEVLVMTNELHLGE
jgi:hypothetical protein